MTSQEILAVMASVRGKSHYFDVLAKLTNEELSELYDRCCDGIRGYDSAFCRQVTLCVDIHIAYRWKELIKAGAG